MADSKRELIAQWIVSTLATSPPAGVPTARRSYLWSQNMDVTTDSITVFLREDQPVSHKAPPGPIVKRVAQFDVECRATGTTSQRPDQRVDKSAAWVVAALCGQEMGPNDPGGPLFLLTEEGPTTFEYDQEKGSYVVATVRVLVTYLSKPDDLEAFA